jgi:hypothetical protein
MVRWRGLCAEEPERSGRVGDGDLPLGRSSTVETCGRDGLETRIDTEGWGGLPFAGLSKGGLGYTVVLGHEAECNRVTILDSDTVGSEGKTPLANHDWMVSLGPDGDGSRESSDGNRETHFEWKRVVVEGEEVGLGRVGGKKL